MDTRSVAIGVVVGVALGASLSAYAQFRMATGVMGIPPGRDASMICVDSSLRPIAGSAPMTYTSRLTDEGKTFSSVVARCP